MTPPAQAAAVLDAAPGGPVGVAVSGGGDSVALLLIALDWAAASGRRIEAVTVDHGLREGSAEEAEAAARLCAARGVAHAVLTWRGWGGRGNLQDAAREARRALIGAWARERGIGGVALGHTLDDQAETFLLRLARGSGVDGLAAMAPVAWAGGLVWLRPLLGRRRAELRAWLTGQGVGWAEDPSNADPAFDRVRARAALPALATLGLGPERLAATALRMARARAALEAATQDLAAVCLARGAAGDLTLDPGPFAAAPEEIRLRLLAGVLAWVSGARYRPRLAPLEAACAAMAVGALGRGLTLHGCVLRPRAGGIAIRREPARVAPPAPLARGVWDGRWALTGAPDAASDRLEIGGLEIGALGAAGLAARPGWRDAGLAREALATSPGVWRAGRLVAAPLLEPGGPFAVRRIAPLPPPWREAELR